MIRPGQPRRAISAIQQDGRFREVIEQHLRTDSVRDRAARPPRATAARGQARRSPSLRLRMNIEAKVPPVRHQPRVYTRDEHDVSRKFISPSALKVLYRLDQAGFRACLVGGSVRDLLLGRVATRHAGVGANLHPAIHH